MSTTAINPGRHSKVRARQAARAARKAQEVKEAARSDIRLNVLSNDSHVVFQIIEHFEDGSQADVAVIPITYDMADAIARGLMGVVEEHRAEHRVAQSRVILPSGVASGGSVILRP